RRGLIDGTSMVTALPRFDGIDLDTPPQLVVGGHDVRRTSYPQAVADLHQRSNVFHPSLIEACLPDLEQLTANLRAGTVLGAGATIARLADLPEAQRQDSPRSAIDRIQTDFRAFQEKQRLDQVVVINVASTEPPFELAPVHKSLKSFMPALDQGEAR